MDERTSDLITRLQRGHVVADGAMGTVLYSRGIDYQECFDALNRSDPDLVRGIHADYVEAGAELIETNTFGANAFRLAEHHLADDVRAINLAGARLAREVADAAGDVWVAGSVGPIGGTLAPLGSLEPERARDAFALQVAALAEGGVDLIMIETMPDLDEARVALEAARAACDLPVAVQLTFNEDGLTRSGASPEEVVAALEAAGADVIGANCGTGPIPLLEVLGRMVEVANTPLSALPNAGLPQIVGGRYMYTSTPAYMADVLGEMVALGVALVGGCCGTTPEHIRAICEALAEAPRLPPRLSFPRPERRTEEAPPDHLMGPTGLEAALEKRFVVTVEVDPPKGFDVAALLPKLRALEACGYVDAIDVADSPRAQARMSALATAALVQSELGLETVLHMGVRHRNLVAIHSELLGAHALGIRNVFVVMGDLPAKGDYPDATVVRDITASGLMRLLTSFNDGCDLNGRVLDHPTAFHVGCAFNFGAADLDRELRVLDKKLEAGARFALTQPVYEPEPVERVLDRLGGEFPIPIIMGVLPLWNARHAAFLHNEVPGIRVPADAMARLIAAGEDGRAEGVRIAQETLRALDGAVQGAYFMPPFERYELVAEVMSGLRTLRQEPSAEGLTASAEAAEAADTADTAEAKEAAS